MVETEDGPLCAEESVQRLFVDFSDRTARYIGAFVCVCVCVCVCARGLQCVFIVFFLFFSIIFFAG